MTSLTRPASHHVLTLSCLLCLALVTAHAVNTPLEAWLEPGVSRLGKLPTVNRPRETPPTPLALEPLARQLGLPISSREAPSPTLPETGPTPNTLGLKLLGTLLASAPSATFASIYDGPTGRTHSVWLGSEFRGAQVLAIERTRVVVLNAGRLESIDAQGSMPVPDTAPRPASPSQPSSVRQVGPTTFEISRQQMTDSLAHVEALATQARIVPSFTDGESRGFKIFSIRPGSLFEQLGLRNGDVLQRINGLSLGGMNQALEAYSRLQDGSHFELEMERNGQVLRQQYTIR